MHRLLAGAGAEFAFATLDGPLLREASRAERLGWHATAHHAPKGFPVDPVSLTAFLAPYLPYLLKGAKFVGEETGKAFAHEGWEAAQRLWQVSLDSLAR